MDTHRFPLIGVALVIGALTLAGFQPSLFSTAAAATKASAVHESHGKAAPRNIKKANKLARLAVTELVRNYAKGRTKTVCSVLTAKLRKALGGSAKCAATVRRTRSSTPISKATIKKIAFRRARTLATITGYLNGNRKQRLSVVLKWEGGRYRLDHSVSALSGILR